MQNSILLTAGKNSDWQFELSSAITSVEELLKLLELEHLSDTLVHNPDFRLLVPRAFANKMQPGNADDPLLKQILPMVSENNHSGNADPVGDLNAMITPGVLHKYKGRVLLITTGACAIHCRYCFRRHFPYSTANPHKDGWRQALKYLATHNDIHEVILSGGDPLVLDNEKLTSLLAALKRIPHIQWLRIHTRLPVVLPSRIDDALITLLQGQRFRTTIVIHANHANELMTDEAEALNRLRACGITLLNQSVLLKGVNDSAAALDDLSSRLYEIGVLPYYLHMLDPVQGGMHFDVPQHRALAILNELRATLPGYLVPRLVKEKPGEASKTAIFTI
jgi:EF-P beta-lysylation protein EpmB